ncbi:MAG TPA: ATP-binding protein, partial [Phnomibacter sp.]|nr:ATP-binding protein [Phnomibacter sp.]
MVKYFWSALFMVATAIGYAQQPLFSHQQWYKVDDGLPQSFVVDIKQDDLGFIWVATRDGLARFDGRTFKVWDSDPRDARKLAGNVAAEMQRLENGKFVITFQGNRVDEFDPVSGTVRHLTSDPLTARYFKRGRRIDFQSSRQWFFHEELSRGLGRIDPDDPAKEVFYHAGNVLTHGDSITGSCLHPDGRLWMVTPAGIYMLDSAGTDLQWHPFEQMHPLGKPYRVRSAEVFLAWDEWLAISAQDALFFWNIHTHELKKISLNFRSSNQYNFPNHFQVDPSGYFFFRQGNGVYRVGRSLKDLTLVWENHLVPGRAVTTCLVDRTGTLWVGLDAAGLVKVNLKTMPLTSIPYTGTFHRTVLQMDGFRPEQLPGGWLDDRYGSYYFRYGYAPDSVLYASYSFGNPVADRQLFWVEDRRFRPLPMPPGMSQVYFRGISFDAQGGIYAYNENGHDLFYWKDRKSLPEIEKVRTMLNIGEFGVADAKVFDGILWMSTYGQGLFQIKNGVAIAHYYSGGGKGSILPDNLTCINPDPVHKDIVWIGSLGEGLIKMHRTKGVQNILTTDDGLPNNTVYCMENDDLGNMWLSTNNGLVRFTPSTGGMHVFYRSDGLPGNEFNRSHSFRLRDGRLAFGGPDGMVLFDPREYEPPGGAFSTRLTITGIDLNGRPLDDLNDTTLTRGPISRLTELNLPYDKNYLGISFAALLYNEPQNIKYRYRLLPDEQDWNEAGNNAYARYTQLSPGKYILEMNATGLHGKWTDEVLRLTVVIHPPIWRTWYAWMAYILLAGGLTLFLLSTRVKQMQAQQQVAFEHREAERLRELDRMKDTFFANITHELRTPLTLIKTPLDELAKNESLPEQVRKTINTARRNSQSLLRLINQLLDINKLGSGQLKVVTTIGEPGLFVRECLEPFAATAVTKGLRFATHIEGLAGSWHFDADKWEKIIYNLVSNAIKFTPEGGQVAFTMKELPSDGSVARVLFTVKDTGIGMDGHDVDHVFDRYYRARTAEEHFAGTGIGMALVKELVKMQGGAIEVSSKPGQGTEFRVWLPVVKAVGGVGPVQAGDQEKMGLNSGTPEKMVSNGKGGKAGANKGSIVVAEDNDDLREFISESLADTYTIAVLPNGRDAWHKIVEDLPDLVITDMMMPDGDGNELCRRIKQDPTTAHIPVVMLTSRTAAEARLMGLGAGADVYLTKPFQMEELRLCLHNLMEQQERQRQRWQAQMQELSPHVPAPADAFSARIYTLLDEHLDNTELGVELLASSMGMSRSTLNRKMQAVNGVST